MNFTIWKSKRSKKIFKIQNSYFAYLWTNEHQNSYSGLSVKKEKLERSDVKVRKSQKYFFLKLYCPKSKQFFWRISGLAYKMDQIKNAHTFLYKFLPNLANYYMLICIFFTWPILEARAEILQKFLAMVFQEKNLLRFPDL